MLLFEAKKSLGMRLDHTYTVTLALRTAGQGGGNRLAD